MFVFHFVYYFLFICYYSYSSLENDLIEIITYMHPQCNQTNIKSTVYYIDKINFEKSSLKFK